MADLSGFLLRFPTFNSPDVPTASLQALLDDAAYSVSKTCLVDLDSVLFDKGIYLLLASSAYQSFPSFGIMAAGQVTEESIEEQYVRTTTKYASRRDPNAVSGYTGVTGRTASDPFEAKYLALLEENCFSIGRFYDTNQCGSCC